ncbi:MAG: TonB-dependent receptor [Bacteroidales bacterium]
MRFLILFVGLMGPYFMYAGITDSVHCLREVQVRAMHYKEVIPSQKLNGIQLERMNSLSVADAIRFFSGIQIKDYGGVGGVKTVDIRSMGTHHLGVFYDGIQLGNAQNGQIDLGKFSMDNIDEISLYNGQKSEIFQTARDFGSAGSIYLKTRVPKFEGAKKYNVRLLFRTGSFHLLNPSFLWEHKITKNISSSFNAEYTYSSGKYKFRLKKVNQDGSLAWDTTAIRQNGDIHALRLEGGFNGSFKSGKWHVKGYFYNSERGIPGAIVNNVWGHSQRQWDRNFFLQTSFLKTFTPKYDLLVNAKYAHDYMRYLNPDTTLMYIDNTFRQQELYVSMAHKYVLLHNWDLALATDFQWNTLEANLRDFVYPQRLTALIALATALHIGPVKIQASLLASLINERVKPVEREEGPLEEGGEHQKKTPANKSEFTPAIFVSYRPFLKHDFTIRAFYKRIFRMPTFNDLYYTDIGNIALKPEYTNQFNLGLQYKKDFENKVFETFSARADAYYNTVTDKIIAVPKGSGQYRWMMMNIGYVQIKGIDISANTSLILPWQMGLHLNINYTYQKAQDYTDPSDNDPIAGTYKGQIAYIPWHNGSVTAGLTYKSWELNYSFLYVGERYHNSSNIRENYEKPWYTSDFSLSKEFAWPKIKFKITAEINNIFNQAYDVVLNYPMPGINYKLIVRVNL